MRMMGSERMTHVVSVLLLILITSDKVVLTATQFFDSSSISGYRLQFGSMKTYIKTKGYVSHLAEDDFKPGNILYSDSHELKTTDGKNTHLIVGSGYGYAEGVSNRARFDWIGGFLQTNSTHVLTADSGNHCLRYINRLTNQTSQFVGKCQSSGLIDGSYTDTLFRRPWSVIKDANNLQTVIVTEWENKALRSIALNSGEVRTLIRSLPDDPFGAVFDSNKEDLVVILRFSLGKFNTKTLAFTALTSTSNRGGLDGDFATGSFSTALAILRIQNNLHLVADRDFNKIRIVDIKNRTITSICEGTFASIDGPIKNCSLTHPSSLLLKSNTLYIGEYQSIRFIKVRTTQPCDDIYVKLSAGQHVKCIEIVPGHEMCVPPGSYNYKLTDRNCSIVIYVVREVKNITCPDGIYGVADAKTLKAKVHLTDGHDITLPIGKHLYDRQLSDNLTCEITVHVLDPRLKKRLGISANYPLSCAMINDFKQIILSVAKMRYNQIKQVTSRFCNQSADQEVLLSCANDVLNVVWTTDCLLQSDSVKEQQMMITVVKEHLQKTEFHILELFIPSHIPPIITPMINRDGLRATFELTPVCLGGLKYMNSTETCL